MRQKILLITLLFCFIPFTTNAEFLDTKNYKYKEAINYLNNKNIINGYQNNLFKPYNEISRAEFIKITLLAFDKDIISNNANNFSDISNDSWYKDYVNTAFNLGIIKGYSDNTFKPNQPISKAEVFSILSKVNNWVINSLPDENIPFNDIEAQDWHFKYIKYAQNNGYLIEQGSKFNPHFNASRGYVSKIIYNILNTNTNPSNENNSNTLISETPNEETNTLINTNINFENNNDDSFTQNLTSSLIPFSGNEVNRKKRLRISKTKFDNIELNKDIPYVYYEDEIYALQGKVLNGQNSIILYIAKSGETGKSLTYNIQGDQTFNIPLYFNESGSYTFGLLAGDSGTIRLFNVFVTKSPQARNRTLNVPTPPETNLIYKDLTFIETSNSKENYISKYEFIQGDKKVILQRRAKSIQTPLPYHVFKEFKEGEVKYTHYINKLRSFNNFTTKYSWKEVSTQNIFISNHYHSTNAKDKITINSLPLKSNQNQIVKITGNSNVNIQSKAILQTPDKKFELIPISKNINFTFKTEQKGMYKLEINNELGLALLNHPIYSGDIIPLIPSYFDLPRKTNQTKSSDLNIQINNVLKLINQERSLNGLNQVIIDEKLNLLAQTHANDLSSNQYFSHINLKNETPDDRRRNMDIKTSIQENLAKANTITEAHHGLVASPNHYQNILKPEWTKVGIGVSKDKFGYLYVVQEFSAEEIDENQLNKLEEQLITKLNKLKANNKYIRNTKLNNSAEEWTETMIIHNFVNFSHGSSNNSLEKIIKKHNINGAISAYIFKTSSLGNLEEYFLNNTKLSTSDDNQIGISINLNTFSDYYLTVISK